MIHIKRKMPVQIGGTTVGSTFYQYIGSDNRFTRLIYNASTHFNLLLGSSYSFNLRSRLNSDDTFMNRISQPTTFQAFIQHISNLFMIHNQLFYFYIFHLFSAIHKGEICLSLNFPQHFAKSGILKGCCDSGLCKHCIGSLHKTGNCETEKQQRYP